MRSSIHSGVLCDDEGERVSEGLDDAATGRGTATGRKTMRCPLTVEDASRLLLALARLVWVDINNNQARFPNGE